MEWNRCMAFTSVYIPYLTAPFIETITWSNVSMEQLFLINILEWRFLLISRVNTGFCAKWLLTVGFKLTMKYVCDEQQCGWWLRLFWLITHITFFTEFFCCRLVVYWIWHNVMCTHVFLFGTWLLVIDTFRTANLAWLEFLDCLLEFYFGLLKIEMIRMIYELKPWILLIDCTFYIQKKKLLDRLKASPRHLSVLRTLSPLRYLALCCSLYTGMFLVVLWFCTIFSTHVAQLTILNFTLKNWLNMGVL